MRSIAVDTGGTFTDIVVLDHETGDTNVIKVPSTPADPGSAIADGLAELFQDAFTPGDVTSLSHGTTVGTNMLLTGKGAQVGLLLTEHFGGINDIWQLPRQEGGEEGVYVNRRPPVPPRLRAGIRERLDSDGSTLVDIDEEQAAKAIRLLGRRGVDSIAVVLLFSFLNPGHERALAALIERELPGCAVSLSSDVLPQIRERARLSTTVANARLDTAMRSYLTNLVRRIREQGVASDQLYVMQSNGGVAGLSRVMPVTTVLSGPCAGAQAGMLVAARSGFANAVSLDMGGTSTDIALGQDGRVVEDTSGRIGDWEIALPMLSINTIGAGGGTMAILDPGGGMRVGPESAGADPGPVCYGKGGETPTVTDANLVLGYLNPDRLLGGRVRMDRDASMRAISELGDALGLEPLQAAEGIIRITDAKMAEGIRAVSTERGYDLRDFVLVAFGGAGPVPAGRIAADLKMHKVVVPPSPGATSAMGLLMADRRRDYVRSRMRLLSEIEAAELTGLFTELNEQGIKEFTEEGFDTSAVRFEYAVDLRYLGQGYELTVPAGDSPKVTTAQLATIRQRFDEMHEQLYGHSAASEQVEAVNYRARAIAVVPKVELREHPAAAEAKERALTGERAVCFSAAEGMAPCPVYDRGRLLPGHVIEGPAIIEQLDSTTVVNPGHRATVDPFLSIIIDLD